MNVPEAVAAVVGPVLLLLIGRLVYQRRGPWWGKRGR